MSNYTKGKWKVEEIDLSNEEIFVSNEDKLIAITMAGMSKHEMEDEEAIANAHLISAASDMYQALKLIEKNISLVDSSCYHDGKHISRIIEAAIKKAEGESK